jgi:hypothetical protein
MTDITLFFNQVSQSQLAGFTQTNNSMDILGASLAAVFLMAAPQEGNKFSCLSDIQDPDSLRGMKLMPGDGQQVYLVRLQVDRNFTGSLDGIGMKMNAFFSG